MRAATALSGGERRRVEIARAIATEPAFLAARRTVHRASIPIAVADIQATIRQLRDRGLGVLITDHQVRETLAIVDRAYILNDGKIVVSGSAHEVLESPVARQFYLGEGFRLVTTRSEAHPAARAGHRLAATILDRYMVAELSGRSSFGLSAFTLIFVGDPDPRDQPARLRRARAARRRDRILPLAAAARSSFWSIPMAMLLGVAARAAAALGRERDHGDEGGRHLASTRSFVPLLVVGFAVSLVALVLQEGVVPFANDRARTICARKRSNTSASSAARDLTVILALPDGGRQLTTFDRLRRATQTLVNVTLIQYDARNAAGADRLQRSRALRDVDLDVSRMRPSTTSPRRHDLDRDAPTQQRSTSVRIRSQIMQRAANNNPENMSRAQIQFDHRDGPALSRRTAHLSDVVSGKAGAAVRLVRLHPDRRAVRPAARARGRRDGLGFGLAVAIVFVYFVIASIVSAVSPASGAGRDWPRSAPGCPTSCSRRSAC